MKKRSTVWATFAISCLSIFGCLPVSDNPLPPYGDLTDLAAPYLGEWNLIQMLGMADVASCTLEVAMRGTAELEITIEDATSTSSSICTLHEIDNIHYVSITVDTDLEVTYGIYRLVLLGPGNNRLEIYALDSHTLENAINLNEIEGTITDLEGSSLIRITDTSENIEAYVRTKSQAFEINPVMVFQKK